MVTTLMRRSAAEALLGPRSSFREGGGCGEPIAQAAVQCMRNSMVSVVFQPSPSIFRLASTMAAWFLVTPGYNPSRSSRSTSMSPLRRIERTATPRDVAPLHEAAALFEARYFALPRPGHSG
jgi:hypothetical protein